MSDLGFAAQLAEDLTPADLRLVLGVFRTDVERLTGALSMAIAAADIVAFRRAAHGLAGAAGAVGAVRLEQACRQAMADAVPMDQAHPEINALAAGALGDLAAFLVRLDLPPLDPPSLDPAS